jgi:hypothetical protein
MLLAGPRALTSRDQLARLWLHESCRVFHDRLTCDEDRRQFKALLVSGVGWREVTGFVPFCVCLCICVVCPTLPARSVLVPAQNCRSSWPTGTASRR